MGNRSKLLPTDFYDRCMYSPESSPAARKIRRNIAWLSILIAAAIITALLMVSGCGRDNHKAVSDETSSLLTGGIDVEKVASDISDDIVERIKGTRSGHELIAKFGDGSVATVSLAPYGQMIKQCGSEELVKEAMKSAIASAIELGVVEFGLRAVELNKSKQA